MENMVNTLLLGKEEKGKTEDKMVGWYHQFNGHEFEQAPVYSEGQGILVCMGSQRVGITQ